MNLLLNLLWVIFGGGLLIWLEYLLGGLLLCMTIVGIPFGLQCFKVAGLSLWPFGRMLDAADTNLAGGIVRIVFNVLWFVVAGVWIFLSHIVLAVSLAVTLIGIPFAIQHVKLAMLAVAPFGQRVR